MYPWSICWQPSIDLGGSNFAGFSVHQSLSVLTTVWICLHLSPLQHQVETSDIFPHSDPPRWKLALLVFHPLYFLKSFLILIWHILAHCRWVTLYLELTFFCRILRASSLVHLHESLAPEFPHTMYLLPSHCNHHCPHTILTLLNLELGESWVDLMFHVFFSLKVSRCPLLSPKVCFFTNQ